MDKNRQMEEFSNAFIVAIAAACGVAVTKPTVDDDSVDFILSKTSASGKMTFAISSAPAQIYIRAEMAKNEQRVSLLVRASEKEL